MSQPINMTAGADTLAWDIFRADNANVPEAELRAGFPAEAEYAITIAKHLRAAGWVKPTVLTTPEQLDALPAGSVILSNGGEDSAQKDDVGYWYLWGGDIGLESTEINLPAAILYEGQA